MDFIQNYWMIWLAIGSVLYILSVVVNGTTTIGYEILNVLMYVILWPIVLLMFVAAVAHHALDEFR